MANVNTVLDEQVTLELESIDRLYLNGYVPILQTPGQLLKFLVKQRGNRIASPAPGLRFGEPRVMALLRALCHWRHLTAGFSNRSLRELVGAELGCPYGARQMTYDLRRLRRKGLIERVPRRHRYMLTALGRRVASFFTKLHLRIVRPALTELDPGLPADSGRQRPLAQAWRRLDQAVDALVASAELAPQM